MHPGAQRRLPEFDGFSVPLHRPLAGVELRRTTPRVGGRRAVVEDVDLRSEPHAIPAGDPTESAEEDVSRAPARSELDDPSTCLAHDVTAVPCVNCYVHRFFLGWEASAFATVNAIH